MALGYLHRCLRIGFMPFGIVICNRYPDIIAPLLESIHRLIDRPLPRIMIVADGHSNSYGFEMVRYQQLNFSFSAATNLGIRSMSEHDIILLNDDTVLMEPNFFDRLAAIGEASPSIGILSPLILGCVGNELQRARGYRQYWLSNEFTKHVRGDKPVCFVAVWLRRKMLDEIGLLDERISGYANQDTDLCIRARKACWLTSITSRLTIRHGDGGPELGPGRGKTWSLSYARRYESNANLTPTGK